MWHMIKPDPHASQHQHMDKNLTRVSHITAGCSTMLVVPIKT
jgi:hypothetical protein